MSIFYLILFYRIFGKFSYKWEGFYIIGIVGMVDVDCDFINLMYVWIDLEDLNCVLKR